VEADISPSGPYFQWFNDQDVCAQNSHGRFPNSEGKMRAFFQSLEHSDTQLVLAIVTKKENKHIGNISLQNINRIDQSAEFAIILGDKDFWGKGLAKEAGDLIVRHGFQELNLNRIYCGTTEENRAMQSLAKHLGMKEEGRRRKAVFRHGKYSDVLEYGVLREEFPSS
jgi:RimJ/RimL family protein N-acetyltransferase